MPVAHGSLPHFQYVSLGPPYLKKRYMWIVHPLGYGADFHVSSVYYIQIMTLGSGADPEKFGGRG